jgi:hypothetical protein
MEHICLSGGAEGADLQWGMTCGTMGHLICHFSFQGHRTRAPASEVVVLSEEQLQAADEPCKAVSGALKRWFPPKSLFVRNLLRRNWYQIKDAERVYAVATIENGIVSGGTAWAVHMFIQRHEGRPCECYVFDQKADGWFAWVDGGWEGIEQPPVPHGVYAAIGSRDLGSNGKEAIRKLTGYVKPQSA